MKPTIKSNWSSCTQAVIALLNSDMAPSSKWKVPPSLLPLATHFAHLWPKILSICSNLKSIYISDQMNVNDTQGPQAHMHGLSKWIALSSQSHAISTPRWHLQLQWDWAPWPAAPRCDCSSNHWRKPQHLPTAFSDAVLGTWRYTAPCSNVQLVKGCQGMSRVKLSEAQLWRINVAR